MIHSAFDCDIPKEVRSVYLDISKAFKLKQVGVGGHMLEIFVNIQVQVIKDSVEQRKYCGLGLRSQVDFKRQ